MNAREQEDLPEIDPQKVSLQIPSEIVSGGFNVVNRAAPVVGEVIQRTAERLVGIGSSLKPLFSSSLGFGQGANYKRETGQEEEVKFGEGADPADEASEDSDVTADAPSQFKRSPSGDQGQDFDEVANEERGEQSNGEIVEEAEEEAEKETNTDEASSDTRAKSTDEKKALTSLLAKQVIAKILENRAKEAENAREVDKGGHSENVESDPAPSKRDAELVQTGSNNPYFIQQYRTYNPHVKRQAPQYVPYQNNFDYYNSQPYRTQYNQYTGMYPYAYSG